MAGKSVTLYEWPDSQLCMECRHGKFITGEDYVNSEYICSINHPYNKGGFCIKQEPRLEEEA